MNERELLKKPSQKPDWASAKAVFLLDLSWQTRTAESWHAATICACKLAILQLTQRWSVFAMPADAGTGRN